MIVPDPSPPGTEMTTTEGGTAMLDNHGDMDPGAELCVIPAPPPGT